MKKRSIWIWALPVIATAMVAWHYTAPMRQSWSQASLRASHPGQVQVVCIPFPVAQGWGYDIVAGNRRIIHQSYVPGVQGDHVFASKEDAAKVGHLVIEKLKQGTFGVTYAEMKNLGVVMN